MSTIKPDFSSFSDTVSIDLPRQVHLLMQETATLQGQPVIYKWLAAIVLREREAMGLGTKELWVPLILAPKIPDP